MKFWDSSSIAALLLDEPERSTMVAIHSTDPVMAVWWGTPVEVVSALVRRTRAGELDAAARRSVVTKLETLAASWEEVMPSADARKVAEQLLWAHPLRAADALQLAAALAAADGAPGALDFVCLDQRLSDAAHREGFRVAP